MRQFPIRPNSPTKQITVPEIKEGWLKSLESNQSHYRKVPNFYGTGMEIWAGFGPVGSKVEIVLRSEIGFVLIIQQKFGKLEFFHCAQWKNLKNWNIGWMIRTQPISLLKLFLLY